MFSYLLFTLGQVQIWHDTEHAAPATQPRAMTFSDLQQGFKQWNDGATDNTLRNGFLIILALIGLLVLILHFRQRAKDNKTPDSEARLAWELSRLIPFPFGTRLLLWWVARSTQVHFAALLISSRSFEQAVETWAAQPTFGLIRRWGKGRLDHLHNLLFSPMPEA